MLNSSVCVFAVEELYSILCPVIIADAKQQLACLALTDFPGGR